MKRTALLIAVMLLVGTTAACGGGEETTPEPTATGAAPVKTQPATTTAATLPAGEASFALLDSNMYFDESGNLIIVGLIENTGDAASCPDYDALQLVDSSGAVITEPYRTTLELIAPGQRAPLVAQIYEYEGIPENWQDLNVVLKEEGYPADLIFEEYVTLETEGLTSKVFESETEDDIDLFGVSGWVVNSGESPVDVRTLLVAGYDAQGDLIDVVQADATPEYLDPDMKTPFLAALSMMEPITDYEIYAEGEVVEQRELVELEVASYTMESPDDYGRTYFKGEIVNSDSALAVETQIVMALVSDEGVVVDIDYTTDSPIPLAPGDRLPFMLSSTPCPARQELWDRPVFLIQGFTEDSMSDTHVAVYSDIELTGLDSLEKLYTTLPGFKTGGKVTNTGQSEADIGIVGAIYDSEGNVVDVAYAYGLMFVEPGESVDIELRFSEAEEAADFKVFYGALSNRY